MKTTSDFLVIGSGIAGLSYALKVAEHGTVAIVTKREIAETATALAQGGIASVFSAVDSFAEHIQDTMVAGAFLPHEDIVKMVVESGPEAIRDLIDWGVQFTKKNDDTYDLHREGVITSYSIHYTKLYEDRGPGGYRKLFRHRRRRDPVQEQDRGYRLQVPVVPFFRYRNNFV